MTARALHSNAKTLAYCDSDSDDDYASEEFYSGERICEPLADPRGNTMLSAAFVIVFALGGGWAALKTKETWEKWLPADAAALVASPERSAPGSVGQTAPAAPPAPSAAAQAPPATQLDSREIADAPGAAAGTPAPPLTTSAIPPAATGSDETAATPLPPPTVDPADPYQKRAAKVGLHPDLSRALLTRMSQTDYQNAGVAIKTALAETPDAAVFVWPKKAEPKLAQFEVHFVAGAPADCRRYVVIVSKDRWSTTAPPMEKCGLSPPARRAKAASG